ncbi:ABC transporter permease [Corynebacterium choanae]|uniref:Ribose transport system permease protein RbsC n=1 Tax=Corynebacterium choanae TaxID=1862358 RepID=A0A3G6J623_9CORY|nr:ABC transporter permease [Corynebacterium choanae]AZA13223.1 Ribose transport system permease protein RbsC [Corynebacterium choanae]
MRDSQIRSPRLRRFRGHIEGQELVLIGVIIVLWLLMSVVTDTFFTTGSLFAILYGVAPIAIMAIAMTAVMVTGGIDVSVGSTMAVVMVVVGKLLRDFAVPAVVAVLIAVVVGAVLGAINGLLISVGKIPAMVCTFGTLNVFRYVALQIFGDNQVAGVPGTLSGIGGDVSASLFGIPNAFWLTIGLGIVAWVYMRHWATGRHLYAIGNDPQAARLAGVRVNWRIFLVYVASGIAVGIAACVSIGAGGLIQQNAGFGVEMSVIAACVIGGTSVMGGRGTVLGSILGAMLVGSVQAAVIHLHLPNTLTLLFVGVIIIIAVGVDLFRQSRREVR